jgi:D-alanyl-D-alanine carboxypeptidase
VNARRGAIAVLLFGSTCRSASGAHGDGPAPGGGRPASSASTPSSPQNVSKLTNNPPGPAASTEQNVSKLTNNPPGPADSTGQNVSKLTIDPAQPGATPTPPPSPFGLPAPVPRYTCPTVVAGGPFRAFLATADTRVSFVDGDDLLALVNRSPTGALPPAYTPTDLVDLRDGAARTAAQCEAAHECLRDEAAKALHRLLDQMRGDGMRGHVQSAFRGFGTQCWVFAGWARHANGGFCEATEQSALPGHSQHQLGTTVDLFTTEWAEAGARSGQGVFRNGFGCSSGGRWIDDNAWRHGFVVPYPIDPDDRKDGSRCMARSDRPVPIDPKTGYKQEPWHLRYIGVDAAARYHAAWLASAPGSPGEITLEQWIRAERRLDGDAELPLCDGCSCGACATLAAEGDQAPCGDASLRLDATGRVWAPAEEPRVVSAGASAADATTARTAGDAAVLVEVTVHAPAHTPTQTPVTTAEGPTYHEQDAFGALVPYPGAQPHRYADLPGAWRVAIEPVPAGAVRWPWRASLARGELAATWNRANVVLPAKAGEVTVRVRVVVPKGALALHVALLRDGREQDLHRVSLP